MKKRSKKAFKPGNTDDIPIPVTPESSGPRSLPNNSLVHIACIVFLIIIVYSNTLNAPFQWDEGMFLINNPIVKDLHYFASPSDAKGFELYSGLVNRYIGYLTFALNYKIHGFSVEGYHIVNIAIHVANAVLVYLFVLLTLRTPFFAGSSIKQNDRYIAFFSSMLFAVHPLQTMAVTYVFQRFVPLAAFFFLLSLTAYIQSRLSEGRRQRFFYYSIAFISAVLAMKTKENAFTLPLVITLFEFCFFADSIKNRAWRLAPILLTIVIVPLTLMSTTGGHQLDPGAYGAKAFSRSDYLFTQFRVIVTYLRLLFFPVNQNIDYDYPVFKSFFDPQVILSFMFLSALFGLGTYLVLRTEKKTGTEGKGLKAEGQGLKTEVKELRSKREGQNSVLAAQSLSRSPQSSALSPAFRLIGFGILWFFITLSVESSIIPILMLINEYRVYLPSVGASIAVVAGAFLIKEKVQSLKTGRVIVVLLVLVTAALSVATFLRNEVWGDRIRLWEDTAEKSPEKATVHFSLGAAYRAHNMPDKAMEQYLIAIKLGPDYAEAYNNLGAIYQARNMPDKAMEQYLIAIKLKPGFVNAHFNLGLIYQARNMPDKAIEQYLIAIKLEPDYAEAYNNLGIIHQALNMPDKAIEQYLTAIKLKPGFAEAYNNLGAIYQTRNMPDKAIEQYLIAIKLKPGFADALLNLGRVYYQTGQMENARTELTAYLKIRPGDQRAQQLLKAILR